MLCLFKYYEKMNEGKNLAATNKAVVMFDIYMDMRLKDFHNPECCQCLYCNQLFSLSLTKRIEQIKADEEGQQGASSESMQPERLSPEGQFIEDEMACDSLNSDNKMKSLRKE